MTLRLYAIVRGDIVMSTGKISAQTGHAFVNTALAAIEQIPKTFKQYQNGGIGTKITLVATNERAVVEAYQKAKQEGLPTTLIIDSGHVYPPDFDGDDIITCCGIGPATKEQIQHITGKFNLM